MRKPKLSPRRSCGPLNRCLVVPRFQHGSRRGRRPQSRVTGSPPRPADKVGGIKRPLAKGREEPARSSPTAIAEPRGYDVEPLGVEESPGDGGARAERCLWSISCDHKSVKRKPLRRRKPRRFQAPATGRVDLVFFCFLQVVVTFREVVNRLIATCGTLMLPSSIIYA